MLESFGWWESRVMPGVFVRPGGEFRGNVTVFHATAGKSFSLRPDPYVLRGASGDLGECCGVVLEWLYRDVFKPLWLWDVSEGDEFRVLTYSAGASSESQYRFLEGVWWYAGLEGWVRMDEAPSESVLVCRVECRPWERAKIGEVWELEFQGKGVEKYVVLENIMGVPSFYRVASYQYVSRWDDRIVSGRKVGVV